MSFILVLQIIVALGLFNVWFLRYNKSTEFRGGGAKNLKEEFAAYGLPEWMHYLVGALKIGAAIVLILGVWQPGLALYAAGLISFLMLGALAMHFKVKDPLKKSVPALCMLVLSLAIVAGNLNTF